ncbi:hypothetical protein [Nocardioides perillae]|uniref:Uncharacterized protein n=1 Tax=Nocardioides perillae TaxID=1119534 RepID=A0A7Y9UUV3_9ACTN|nr:hypothetical protein [Nocardioides perillae]
MQAGVAVGGGLDRVALADEQPLQQAAQPGVVLDQQHARAGTVARRRPGCGGRSTAVQGLAHDLKRGGPPLRKL